MMWNMLCSAVQFAAISISPAVNYTVPGPWNCCEHWQNKYELLNSLVYDYSCNHIKSFYHSWCIGLPHCTSQYVLRSNFDELAQQEKLRQLFILIRNIHTPLASVDLFNLTEGREKSAWLLRLVKIPAGKYQCVGCVSYFKQGTADMSCLDLNKCLQWY